MELYLFLDNVRSAYNVGSIFRTAEAFAIKKIYLGGISGIERFGNQVKLHPKVLKTALAGKIVPWEHVTDPIKKLSELKSSGVNIISLEISSDSTDIKNLKLKDPTCLVVGHEITGVEQGINSLANQKIKIPMYGKGKSLNVSVATGIALYYLKLATN